MSHPNILVTDSDGILGIEISRRDKKNAITSDMYRAMSAAELLLGKTFDAATALAAGIVNRVLAADRLLETAYAAARKLVAQPAQALAVTKAPMKRPPERGAIEAMDEETIYFSELVAAPAAKEIFSAFLERRAADPTAIRGSKA